MSTRIDEAIAVLNGLIGDYLGKAKNGLAIDLGFVHEGVPLACSSAALARAHAEPSRRVVILVHGLMCTEAVFRFPDGTHYGSLLARDFGFTPFCVRYNTGLPIADNGAAFATLLEAFVAAYPTPLEELLFLGYSMGGLVVRSACHFAGTEGHSWLGHVKRAIYVGTPHRGAPLERGGRVLARFLNQFPDPYVQLIGELANLRSAGLQDLGDAELRHEDRARRRVGLRLTDVEHPVPLLPSIQHYLVAGSLSEDRWLTALFGDALVPVPSATFLQGEKTGALPPAHVRIVPGVNHVALAKSPAVYEHIRTFLEAP